MRRFVPGTRDDDATLRALLRDNVMPSWITLALEREPSYFADAERCGREWTVIARDGEEPIGMCACSARRVHVDGAATAVGYLHGLRVREAYRHRLTLLRDGFAALRALQVPQPWFTSIASDNHVARRVLEANLAGMPRYDFAGELVTLVISRARARRHGRWRRARDPQAFCDFHNAQAQQFDFSPHLSPEWLARTGADPFVADRACMALWNRQLERQVVVRGYREPLLSLRWAYNLAARWWGRVELPPVGERLDASFLAFLAVDGDADVEVLVADALALCPTKLMVLALHAQHPWLPRLAGFGAVQYRTRIYRVGSESERPAAVRPAQPDAALL